MGVVTNSKAPNKALLKPKISLIRTKSNIKLTRAKITLANLNVKKDAPNNLKIKTVE